MNDPESTAPSSRRPLHVLHTAPRGRYGATSSGTRLTRRTRLGAYISAPGKHRTDRAAYLRIPLATERGPWASAS